MPAPTDTRVSFDLRRSGPALDPDQGTAVIDACFEPDDTVCLLLKSWVRERRPDRLKPVIQRMVRAGDLCSRAFTDRLKERNRQGYDVYIGVNPYKTGSTQRIKDNIKCVRRIHCDIDSGPEDAADSFARIRKDIDDFRVDPPAVTVNTSPGKFHLMWNIDPPDIPLGVGSAEALNRVVAARYGGDLASTDVTRVLRLPGYRSNKYLAKLGEEGRFDEELESSGAGLVAVPRNQLKQLAPWPYRCGEGADFQGVVARLTEPELLAVRYDFSDRPPDFLEKLYHNYGAPDPSGGALNPVVLGSPSCGRSADVPPAGSGRSGRPASSGAAPDKSGSSGRSGGPAAVDTSDLEILFGAGAPPRAAAPRPRSSGSAGPQGRSQSHRDWHWVLQRLREGGKPNEIVGALYEYRSTDTRSPKQEVGLYALRTVHNACIATWDKRKHLPDPLPTLQYDRKMKILVPAPAPVVRGGGGAAGTGVPPRFSSRDAVVHRSGPGGAGAR